MQKKISLAEAESRICGNCKNFREHYIRRDGEVFCLTPYGHCVFPQLKARRSSVKGCVHWEQTENTKPTEYSVCVRGKPTE